MANKHQRIAIDYYDENKLDVLCAYCGLGLPLLEVAHIDHNNKNNDPDNLAFLCPTCHRMLDLGMIPQEVIKTMRGHTKEADWSILYGDAHKKATATLKKKKEELRKLRREIALKAWETRRANEEKNKAEKSE